MDIKEIDIKHEYVVMLPGAQMQVISPLKFNEFVASINKQIQEDHRLVLEPMEGNYFCMYITKDQHLPVSIMTAQCFNKMQAHAKWANAGQGKH